MSLIVSVVAHRLVQYRGRTSVLFSRGETTRCKGGNSVSLMPCYSSYSFARPALSTAALSCIEIVPRLISQYFGLPSPLTSPLTPDPHPSPHPHPHPSPPTPHAPHFPSLLTTMSLGIFHCDICGRDLTKPHKARHLKRCKKSILK